MKKLMLAVFVALLSFALNGGASEIAEVAKKERERREAFHKSGKTAKVFTNQDIPNLKSTLGFAVTTPAPAETAQPTRIVTLPAVDRTAVEPQPSREEIEREQAQKEEADRLKEERETLEQQARDAQQVINQGGGYHTRNIGNQYKAKREAETRIREIDEKLEQEKESDDQQ